MRSRRLGRHAKHRTLKIALRVLALLVLLFVLAWPLIEPHTLRVSSLSLENDAIPEGMRPLRIVYLSDLHVGSWPFYTMGQVPALVKKINALNPDLILLGGDYATDPESCEAFFRQLPSMHANYGIFAVLGELDRYGEGTVTEAERSESVSRLRAAMVAKGITPLINDVATIRIGTDTLIQVAGIDDSKNGNPALEEVALKCQRENYVIFLSHNPSVIPQLQSAQGTAGSRNWFDLGLFGHTMGGQIAPFRHLLGLTDDIADTYLYGTLVEGRAQLVISGGIGTRKLPVRLFCPPEIHLITVRHTR